MEESTLPALHLRIPASTPLGMTLTVLYSLFSILYSLFSIRYSLFATRYSLFNNRRLRLPLSHAGDVFLGICEGAIAP